MASSDCTRRAPRAWQVSNEHLHCFPDEAGCYVIYFDGAIGYIGQSVCLSTRISQYRIHRNIFGGKEWVTPWGSFDSVVIKFKLGRRYGDWLMREARLIRRLKPPMNTHGHGYRSQRKLRPA